MASGHQHWRVRLAHLAPQTSLRASQRRQLRKLLGRAWGLEWRLPSRTGDALDQAIVTRAKTAGHVIDRFRKTA